MKTDKKRSFRGAVLLTVVSVMSLLIIFLTSTLALATAANNRAHKSYSSSQASYTARAAIDSILKAASGDDSFKTAMASLTAGNGFDVDVDMEASVAGIGKVDKARVEYAGKKQFYNTEKQEWEERDLLLITADVTSGGETKTVSAYAIKNPPQLGGGGGGGGGFVTVGGAGTPVGTASYGGTYLGIGMHGGQRYYYGNCGLPTGQIVSLDDKLYLNLKNTDQPGNMDAMGNYLPNNPENADILEKFSFPNPGIVEAPVVINGSFDVITKTDLHFPTKGSGMSVWGNLTFTNSDFKVHSETVNNNNSNAYNQEIAKFSDIPYIYVDSLMKCVVGYTLGESDIPLNIFCGSLDAASNGSMQFYADIYCQDRGKTSYLGNSSANSKLHAWSTSVVNGTEAYLSTVTSGNFYTKGNLVIDGNGAEIAGDLVVEGDLTVNGRLDVGGSIVVGGTLIANNDITVGAGHSICADSATGSKITINATKKMTADGTQELYERQDNITYCVLGKNVGFVESWGTTTYPYAWLTPDAITAYGMTDNDGDGIIDGNFYDFGGTVIDPSLIVERTYSVGDENTVTREYTHDVLWVNRDDPTDVTANEMDTYEAGGSFVYNSSTNIAGTDFYKTTHNNELFPRKAEKTVILGFEEIGDGTPKADSKVLKTVEEIELDYNFGTRAITDIPTAGNYLADVNANVYTSSNLPAEITQSCTLSGGFSQDIVIKNTSTNDIWVKLDNFSMFNNGDFIYDDSSAGCGNLNVFVENSATFLTGRRMLTKTYKDYLDSNTAFQIVTNNDLVRAGCGPVVECPKINIYSKAAEYALDGSLISQPEFKMSNGASIVTAAIEAPHMKFDITNAPNINNTIYYDAIEVKNAQGGGKSIGVIGILNVAEGYMQNDWIFLYTPKSGTNNNNNNNNNNSNNDFVVMYYEGF
ncbi:MAG: hypothetical protein NC205_02895 [Prevotella sp.]|nr:hypothetical protein [Alistipes senegalensis]MCM1357514.1 hypothetical protein [Prevotella sp.]MCM1473552.1 hypothetical protein [Muribaculaceae bacterium]